MLEEVKKLYEEVVAMTDAYPIEAIGYVTGTEEKKENKKKDKEIAQN